MGPERHETSRMGTKDAARPTVAALALADDQFGVAHLWQLEALGITSRRVRSWVTSGRAQRIHQGVYVLGHRALRREGYWKAATLACGDRADLSFKSAAALHDLEQTPSGAIDVTVPGRSGRIRKGIRVHSGDHLADDERTVVDGIPCTTIERTILDLASVYDQRRLERLCERAARIDEFDPIALAVLVARHRGRRGVARLRSVLAEWDPDLARVNGELEARLLRAILRAGIERPIVNGRIEAGGTVHEVDFHWPCHRLIVETDGKYFHDTPVAARRDASRDRLHSVAGWHTLRFDWAAVTERETATLTRITDRLS